MGKIYQVYGIGQVTCDEMWYMIESAYLDEDWEYGDSLMNIMDREDGI